MVVEQLFTAIAPFWKGVARRSRSQNAAARIHVHQQRRMQVQVLSLSNGQLHGQRHDVRTTLEQRLVNMPGDAGME